MQVYREETVNPTKQIIMQKKKDLINNTFGIIIIYWSIYTSLIAYF